MTIPIIIVGYRNADDIIACLDALADSTHHDFVVRVCENGGEPAWDELRVRIGGVVQGPSTWRGSLPTGQPVFGRLAARNLGYAGAINLVLDEIAGERWQFAWILNPDTQPDPHALERLVEKATDGAYGIVGSRIQFAATNTVQMYGVRWRSWLGRGLSLGLGADANASVDELAVEHQVDFVSGASMLVSRPFVDHVGPMVDDYFLYFEDADWCLRRGPFKLGYAHQSIIAHGHGTTIGSNSNPRWQSPLSAYLTERNRLLLTRRHRRLQLPIVAVLALAFLARTALRGAPRTSWFGLTGWAAGLLGRSGPPPRRIAVPRQ